MIINGIVESIESDGYERLLSIRTEKGIIFCSLFEHDEWLDFGMNSKKITKGLFVNFSAKVVFALKFEILEATSPTGLVQNLKGSPSVTLSGLVIGKKDTNIYTLNIDNDCLIDVVFETDFNIEMNTKIRTIGELMIEY